MSDDTLKSQKRPHGLGRGLSALLGDVAQETPISASAGESGGAGRVQSIDVSRIAPHPEQPRRQFDEAALQELADSISQRGVIQPIIVRPIGQNFQIVAGERRWRAAQKAQLHAIPAIVRDFDEAQTLEIALVENIQREDLNPIEEAQAYSKLIADFGHSQEALARIVGKSRSHVANLVRLLDLPAAIQQAVMESRISMGHARALIGADNAVALAQTVEEKGLSVRQTEALANNAKGRPPAPKNVAASPANRPKDADILELERQLSNLLGITVDIAHGAGEAGAVTLHYSTLDQLDMLCQRLSGESF